MTIPTKLAEAVQRLRYLKDKKQEFEEKLTRINIESKELQERVIPRFLEDAEIEKAKVEGAGTIYVKQELFVSLTQPGGEDGEVEPPFYDWARSNAPDLIKPYIHPARLKAYCKERLENGMALPDNMIKASFVPTAKLLRR